MSASEEAIAAPDPNAEDGAEADRVRATADREREPARPIPGGSRFAVLLCASVTVLALVLDALTKVLAVAQLTGQAPVRLLGGVIYLDLTRNSGAAFSLGTGFTLILTIVALIVVAVIVRTASRMRSLGWAVALGLILGGALGNLGDRVFRAPSVGRGQVVDFISAFGPNGEHWPIFNLADSAVTCGAVLAALLAICGVELGGRLRND